MKMKKRRMKAKTAFGITTKRFAGIGYHPDLDPSGSMKQNKINLGPGQYNPELCECIHKKYNVMGSIWDKQLKVEEFSKNLGYRNGPILAHRQFMAKHLGPGSHDVSEEIYQRQNETALYNVSFGRQKRFNTAKCANLNPPPGTYEKGDVASNPIGRQYITTLPTLEWDGFLDRNKDISKAWMISPNRYNPQDRTCIDALLAKVVSKRGPYDLFTGPRDGTTIKNKFSPPIKCSPDAFYTWPTDLDYLLHDKERRRYGRFFKATRFPKKPNVRNMLNDISLCYRDPNSPSPASYKVKTNCISVKPPNLYPFNDGLIDCRQGAKWKISPGPGRYDTKNAKCRESKNMETWIFRSKTKRTEYKAVDYNSF